MTRAQRLMSATDHVLHLLYTGRSMGCADIGGAIWPDRKTSGVSCNGGGDYPAQMLLGRMRKAGLVRVELGDGSSKWIITPAGKTRYVYGRDAAKETK